MYTHYNTTIEICQIVKNNYRPLSVSGAVKCATSRATAGSLVTKFYIKRLTIGNTNYNVKRKVIRTGGLFLSLS